MYRSLILALLSLFIFSPTTSMAADQCREKITVFADIPEGNIQVSPADNGRAILVTATKETPKYHLSATTQIPLKKGVRVSLMEDGRKVLYTVGTESTPADQGADSLQSAGDLIDWDNVDLSIQHSAIDERDIRFVAKFKWEHKAIKKTAHRSPLGRIGLASAPGANSFRTAGLLNTTQERNYNTTDSRLPMPGYSFRIPSFMGQLDEAKMVGAIKPCIDWLFSRSRPGQDEPSYLDVEG